MDKQRDFVLRTIEERGVKFVRLWFTDVIGTLKSVAIAPAEVEGAFSEGLGFDGSAIEGLTRSYESDLLAHPDPTTFQILPWRGEIDPTARMFCDITTPDGQPAVADPRHVLKRSLAKAADAGFTFYTHPEIEFYLLKSSSFGAGRPRAGRLGRLLRQRPRRHGPRLPPALGADARGPRHLGRVQPPRGRARPERDRPALRRRARDGRQHHDLPHRHQGGRDRAGRLRDVHAEAARRQARQRHAHAHVAVRGRRQRVLRGGRAVPALQGRPPVHRRPAASRERDLGGHEPVRQLVQAAVGRRRGAELHHAGATTTAPRSCACRCTSRARASPRASSTARSTPRRTPTSRTRSCSPPGSRASRRGTSCPPRRRTTSGR